MEGWNGEEENSVPAVNVSSVYVFIPDFAWGLLGVIFGYIQKWKFYSEHTLRSAKSWVLAVALKEIDVYQCCLVDYSNTKRYIKIDDVQHLMKLQIKYRPLLRQGLEENEGATASPNCPPMELLHIARRAGNCKCGR